MFSVRIVSLFSYLFLSFFSFSLSAAHDAVNVPADEVTFEYLSSNPWTNHVVFFEKIFKKIFPGTFLEFGIGNSTKYFLENATKVVSVELNAECTSVQTEEWFSKYKNKFSHFENWTPVLHNCSKLMSDLTQLAWKELRIDAPPRTFFVEIKSLIDFSLTLCHHDCSVAFVDSTLYGRAFIVNELLRRHIPIVAAHDTDLGLNFYGWGKLITPSEYVLINFKGPNTNQLSVWILKGILSEQDLLELHKTN